MGGSADTFKMDTVKEVMVTGAQVARPSASQASVLTLKFHLVEFMFLACKTDESQKFSHIPAIRRLKMSFEPSHNNRFIVPSAGGGLLSI